MAGRKETGRVGKATMLELGAIVGTQDFRIEDLDQIECVPQAAAQPAVPQSDDLGAETLQMGRTFLQDLQAQVVAREAKK